MQFWEILLKCKEVKVSIKSLSEKLPKKTEADMKRSFLFQQDWGARFVYSFSGRLIISGKDFHISLSSLKLFSLSSTILRITYKLKTIIRDEISVKFQGILGF
jgi:hypothetical protein